MLGTFRRWLSAARLASAIRQGISTLERSPSIYEDDRAHGSRIAGIDRKVAELHIFYERHYSPIAFFEMRRGERPTYIGSRTYPRTCRFCSKKEPEVAFSDDAHAVSHMVGNRSLFLAEECNGCNKKTSSIENDFGNLTLPDRTWAQVPGKDGVPSFKTFSKMSRVDMTSDGLHIKQGYGDELVDFDPIKRPNSFISTTFSTSIVL